MIPPTAEQPVLIQLHDLCRRLGIAERDARYVCERKWLPPGVAHEPGRGNHRRLTPRQAMWLGVVLKLKAAGLKTPLAARIANFAEGIRGLSRNLVWDWPFSPFDGALATKHRWFIEVGDLQVIRFVTDANPSKEGLYEMPWIDLNTRRQAPGVSPIVSIRVDLSALARLLAAPPGDS